jgi:hypothetical protein
MPTTVYYVCNLQSQALQLQAETNVSTSYNTASKAFNAIALSIYVSLLLYLLAMFCFPLALGQMFTGLENILSTGGFTTPKLMWIAILGISSQLIALIISIFVHATTQMWLYGSLSLIFFDVIGTLTFSSNYLFIKFSTLFLLGTLMNTSVTKYLNVDKHYTAKEAKSCLKNFHLLVSNVGPLLLIIIAIDSLLVMLNSFMIYLTYSTQLYLFMLGFVLSDVHVICSLIYTCILCDDFSTALKALLIPLRSFMYSTLQ